MNHHLPTHPVDRVPIDADVPDRSTRSRTVRGIVALAVGLLGSATACGSGDGAESDPTPVVAVTTHEPSTTLAVVPTSASPTTEIASAVGVIALGHSGLTGENSDPSRPGGPAVENSWATGTNPEVNSIYQRLIAVHPATDGHVANAATGGAPVGALVEQARRALELVPHPQLVIIQTIDGDIRCDGRDSDHVPAFGAALEDALTTITDAAPQAHVLLVGQLGRPRREFVEQLVAFEPSLQADMTGTGVCDFFTPEGELDDENLAALTAIIDGYEAEQSRVCATFERCATDGGVRAAYVDTIDNLSSDLNHLNVRGQAAAAELIWPVVAAHLGLE